MALAVAEPLERPGGFGRRVGTGLAARVSHPRADRLRGPERGAGIVAGAEEPGNAVELLGRHHGGRRRPTDGSEELTTGVHDGSGFETRGAGESGSRSMGVSEEESPTLRFPGSPAQ